MSSKATKCWNRYRMERWSDRPRMKRFLKRERRKAARRMDKNECQA